MFLHSAHRPSETPHLVALCTATRRHTRHDSGSLNPRPIPAANRGAGLQFSRSALDRTVGESYPTGFRIESSSERRADPCYSSPTVSGELGKLSQITQRSRAGPHGQIVDVPIRPSQKEVTQVIQLIPQEAQLRAHRRTNVRYSTAPD